MTQYIAVKLPVWQRVYRVLYEQVHGVRSYKPAYMSVEKPAEKVFVDCRTAKEYYDWHTKMMPRKPLEPTMCVGKYKRELSDSMTRSSNPAATISLADTSDAEGKIWIYNVSVLDFEANTSLGLVKFPSKGSKRYAVATSLPENVMHPRYNVDSNEVHGVYTYGARVAMDMINPGNLGLDQDEKPVQGDLTSQSMGRDLGAKGVFWSLHNPPLEKELAAARKRMKTRYKNLLQEAGVISRVTPKAEFEREIKNLMEKFHWDRPAAMLHVYHKLLQITPEHHAAMDYYKLTSEWHPIKGFTTVQ